jgi:addiction module RelB/DinJ family antitoxin
MNTTSILIKTDPKIKKAAQKTAEEMGISLTSVINSYLKYFIQTKSITFTINDDVPSQYMIDSLKQSEEDFKTGGYISFKNSDDEFAYLDKMIEDERQNQPVR